MVVKLIKVDVIKPNDGKKDNNSLINPVMYLVMGIMRSEERRVGK